MAYQAWLTRQQVNDVLRGLNSVRDFILENISRFEVEGVAPPHHRVGFLKNNSYHFTSKGFNEACGNSDPQTVKRLLKQKGFLISNRSKGYGSNIHIKNVKGKISVYSISDEILSNSENDF